MADIWTDSVILINYIHVHQNMGLQGEGVIIISPRYCSMGVGTGGGTGGTCPPIILPSEIFLTHYALLSRKFAHKMFIFDKFFRLASLANLHVDTSNLEIYKLKCSNYFTSFILKVSVLVQNFQKVCNQLFNVQSPS